METGKVYLAPMQWIKHSYPLVCVFALMISGCLTDGPNKTGGAFLKEQGVIVSRALDSVVIESFPVDSFWVSPTTGPVVGGSRWVVGRQGYFYSVARLGFGRSSGAVRSSDSLLISLTPNISDSLLQMSLNDRLVALDSLQFEIKSVVHRLKSTEINTPARNFLEWFATVENQAGAFDGQIAIDTLTLLNPKAMFDSVAVYKFSLPNLHGLFLEDTAETFAFLEISLLDSAVEPGLLRFSQASVLRMDSAGTTVDSAVQFTFFPRGGISQSMTAYLLSNTNPNKGQMILTGPSQAINFRVDRSELASALKNETGVDIEGGSQDFYNQYYVPYAEVSIPFDTGAFVEGGYGVKLQLSSQLDSLLDPESPDGILVRAPLNEIVPAPFYRELTFVTEVDSLHFHYFKNDSLGNFRLAITHSVDVRQNDTLSINDFTAFRHSHRGIITLEMTPDSTGCWIKSFVSFGEALTSTQKKDREGAYLSGTESITFNGTFGFQKLFNRAGDENRLNFDFTLSPVANFRVLESVNTDLPFSLSSEVPLKLDAQGNLLVDLKLFFMRL